MKQFKVTSMTDRRKKYTVTKSKGKWSCSCFYWIYRRARCKHIQSVA